MYLSPVLTHMLTITQKRQLICTNNQTFSLSVLTPYFLYAKKKGFDKQAKIEYWKGNLTQINLN